MKRFKAIYLIIITALLAAYYLALAIYLHKAGYTNQESLFYIEKAQIIFGGVGDKLRIMGLTSPILPFYSVVFFSLFNNELAPVLASAIGTAALFYIMANSMMKRNKDIFYLYLLIGIFALHPGMLYTACSGKSIYLDLILFFLFFLNLLKYYNSNTTFHVSIASLFFVMLIFTDYKMIWLCLFFIPLVLAISVHSLNLGEKESVFRLFMSFNNPSLRRKLINKTFSIYTIIFLLPLASVLIYKMLNLTHADDLNYFLDSPYATWNIITDNLEYTMKETATKYDISEVSILVSLKALLFCPLLVLAIYLFKQHLYQILTLLTPFGLIEFLKVKYDQVNLVYEYYLLFLILALLCIIFRIRFIKNQNPLKVCLVAVIAVQCYIGYIFLNNSAIGEESNFAEVLFRNKQERVDDENYNLANYIKSMPADTHILADDAVAYAIVGYTNNINRFTIPFQSEYLSAVEAPDKYNGYVLIANTGNPMLSYTQLTEAYLESIKVKNEALRLTKVYITDNWTLYKIM